MSSDPATTILTLTNTQAKELAGRLLTIGSESYCFKDYDRDRPGQPPWRSGAEGKAFPLLGFDQSVVAYLKFFTRPTAKRLDRTMWLIAQRMHAWLPNLAAAPLAWGDTRIARSDTNADFDFAGYLARAVPGKTWLELKTAVSEDSIRLSGDARRRCVRDLLVSLAVLEEAGVVHGDLSPNNIVIDLEPSGERSSLYLIDFDAFVAESAGQNRAVTVAEGGTYGTDGYCPPDLAAAATGGDGSIAPRSDRYGRDMLLLELLLMDCGLSADDPPSLWDRDLVDLRMAARALAAMGNFCRRWLTWTPRPCSTCATKTAPARPSLPPGLACRCRRGPTGGRPGGCGARRRCCSAAACRQRTPRNLRDAGERAGRPRPRWAISSPGAGAVRQPIQSIELFGKTLRR